MEADEEIILEGPPISYEPCKGGLGFEIFRALNANKGKIAQYIIETGEVIKYEDLLEKSVKTAIFLTRKNLKKGDVVVLCMRNNSNCLIPFISAQFSGTIYSAIEPTLPENDILYFLDLLQPKIVFTTEEFAGKLENCVRKSGINCDVVDFTLIEALENVEVESFQPVFVENLRETAIIFLTSGTTGKSKGICCSHYSFLSQIFVLLNVTYCKGTFSYSNFSVKYNERENLKYLVYAPLHWVSGVMVCSSILFCGSASVLGAVFTPENAWKALEKYQPDSMFLPPGQANELCFYAENKEINKSLEIFMTGGGLVTKTHLENIQKSFPNAKAIQAYGQTENCGLTASFKVDDEEDMKLLKENLGSVGKICGGLQLKIVDLDTEESCKANQQGEIRIKNKFMMTGYYKMDSSSAFDSRGWFRTGDLGFFNEKGCVYVVDRIKDMLLYTLYNIRPSVIEGILFEHPAVLECFVFGFPHPTDNEYPMGVVVLKENYRGKIDGKEIEKFVNDRVPSDRYKIRAGVKILDRMLLTPTGKLRKIEMKQRIIAGTL